MRKSSILLFLIAGLGLACSIAAAQDGELQRREESTTFKGIYWKRGIGEKPNIAQITDGKTFTNVSEREYREGGYTPRFEELPEQIIQRLPAQQQ